MAGRSIDHEAARAAILKALKDANTRRAAAAAAGISEATLARWIADDEGFADSIKKAEADAEQTLVKHIRKEAAGGTWQAAAWLLERHPQFRRDWKRTDDLDPRKLSIEQLLALATAGERGAESTGDRVAAAAQGEDSGRDPILPADPTAEAEAVP